MAEENVKDQEAKPLSGDVSIHCFVCGDKVSVKGKVPGQNIDCAKCETTLTVPNEDVLKKLKSFESFTDVPSETISEDDNKKSASSKNEVKTDNKSAEPEKPEEAEKPVPHKIFCEGCGAKIDVTDQPVGSRFSCPACGMVLKVPERKAAASAKSQKSEKKETSGKSKKDDADKKKPSPESKSNAKPPAPTLEKLKINCHTCGAKIDVTDQEAFREVNCPACNARFQVPKRFNHFLLEERLGENSNFAVYRALDLTLSREVCLKVMSKELCENSDMVDKFLEEAGRTALVNDPNIVPIYSSGEDDGQSFLVMQYMGALSLKPYLEKAKGLLPLKSVYRCMRDAAKGLKAAEKNGISHNNISLSNILVDRDGNIKIGDFGLNYSLFNLNKEQNLASFFNPLYLSPEMVRDKKNDKAGDIYSLGAVFYHLITGVPTFPGNKAEEIIKQRLERKPVQPHKVRNEISQEVSDYVMKMMSDKPSDRPESFEAIVKKLETFMENDTTSTKPKGDSSNKGLFPAVDPGKFTEPDKSATPKTQPAVEEIEEYSRSNAPLLIGLIVAVALVVILIMKQQQSGLPGNGGNGGDVAAGPNGNGETAGGVNNGDGSVTTPVEVADPNDPIIMRGHSVSISERPKPSGISFVGHTSLLDYLSLHGGDAHEQEKERIKLLRTTKSYLEVLLNRIPYQGPITVIGRNSIDGEIIEVTRRDVTIRANESDLTMSWNNFEIKQFLDILDYYIAMNKEQLESITAEDVVAGIKKNIADDCFRAALICDWYETETDRLYSYMRECLAHNPALRPQLETLLPSISR